MEKMKMDFKEEYIKLRDYVAKQRMAQKKYVELNKQPDMQLEAKAMLNDVYFYNTLIDKYLEETNEEYYYEVEVEYEVS
jgi:hypothetical protein